MSDQMSIECSNIDISESSLHRILKNCTSFKSSESLLIEDYNDASSHSICDHYKMMSSHSSYSTHSSNISTSSYASDESFGENILEDNGRISLAYENLRTIPKRIAEKFAAHTKCLDLSYNNFQNLSFLSFFEALHTLILDRNGHLNVNTLPYLPNLRILWINNCDISNVTVWIQRISMQCPQLEHLSIMGNPGINSSFSFCTLPINSSNNLVPPTNVVSDYREYILHVMPNLQVLDGVAQYTISTNSVQQVNNFNHGQYNSNNSFKSPAAAKTLKNGTKALNGTKTPTTTTTTNYNNNNNNNNNKNNSQSDNIYIGSRNNSSNSNNSNNTHMHNNSSNITKNSPTLSFKEIFRLKRRKKSYQSSSTN